MKSHYSLAVVTLLFVMACNDTKKTTMSPNDSKEIIQSITKSLNSIPEPVAPMIEKKLVMHGDTRIDPYYWLNNREDPNVRSYLQAENDYLEKVMEPVKTLRSNLYDEMLGRIKQDDNTVPYNYNQYSYYIRFETGKEYPIHCRKKLPAESNPEEIVLNVNQLAEGHKFCNVISPEISPDNKLAVYGLDTTGRNLHKAFVKNLETGAIIEENSPVIAGAIVWTPNSKAFFYETKDLTTLRNDKIWLHELGTPFENDKLVYHETDETSYAHLSSSKDEQYAFIHSGYTEMVECHFIPLNDYHKKPILIKKRIPGFYYTVDHYQGSFLILTNDHAPNFKLVKTPVSNYQYEHWMDMIPGNDAVLLQDIEIFKNQLVVFERKDGLNQIHILPWNNFKEGHYIKFRDASYDCWLGPNFDLNTDILRLEYTSLTTPKTTYDYQMQQQQLQVLKESPVLGNFNKENYQSEYVQVPSNDGEMIPMSIVYRKGFEKNAAAPALLYGYGSYGITMDAGFSSNLISLLDRGFVFAMAHIRGGKEKGWNWYEKGKMFHKINSFTDFINCGEYLVQNKYTSSAKMFCKGGSAGGLLVGAVYNMRPDLFCGMIANVPFVDVLTTMSDPDLPLTTGEYTEWGNPEIKEQYDYMKSYSPIDNVQAKKYTNLLVTTGFADSQVQYWEPAKWVAKLRTVRTDKTDVILFHTNLDAGHGGASGRFERLKEIALEYAFMLALLEK